MISNTLPYDQSDNDAVPSLSNNSAIYVYSSRKYHFPRHKTPYLLVTNYLNKGNYILNGRRIQTSDRSFYFLNSNDELEMRFDQPLQTLLILFEESFVKDSFHTLHAADHELLDNPDRKSSEQRVPNLPFELSSSMKNHIERLLCQPNNQDDFDAQLFLMLNEISLLNRDIGVKLRKLKVVKKSTQEELYRRVCEAKDFMNDQIENNVNLDQIAGEIGMSKFHFLSNFKKIFNTTPHQYLTELKLQKALVLLKAGKHNVSEICFQLGFESLGSFSNLFKRRFSVPPSDFLKPH